MSSIIKLVGIILIIGGIAMLAYQGITYTKHEQVAQIGGLKITAETENTVNFPPIVGGISLIAGIILVLFNKRN